MLQPQDDLPPNPNLGFGSGFIIDPAGVVVTNWHVVEGADEVVVTLTDGRKFTSADIKSDQGSDDPDLRLRRAGLFDDGDEAPAGGLGHRRRQPRQGARTPLRERPLEHRYRLVGRSVRTPRPSGRGPPTMWRRRRSSCRN